MVAHPTTTLLDAWQSAAAVPAAARPVALLEALAPSDAPGSEYLALLPIGERDARLLLLRGSIFGRHMVALATCPACQDSLEFALDARELASPAPEPGPRELTVREDGEEAQFRLPNSQDLAAVAGCESDDAARRALLARCVIAHSRNGIATPASELSDAIGRVIAERMYAADPRASIEVALTCPVCSHRWNAPFDIAAYLWIELNAWARRVLGEVDCLARVYGWSEPDILSMSAERRRLYVNLALS